MAARKPSASRGSAGSPSTSKKYVPESVEDERARHRDPGRAARSSQRRGGGEEEREEEQVGGRASRGGSRRCPRADRWAKRFGCGAPCCSPSFASSALATITARPRARDDAVRVVKVGVELRLDEPELAVRVVVAIGSSFRLPPGLRKTSNELGPPAAAATNACRSPISGNENESAVEHLGALRDDVLRRSAPAEYESTIGIDGATSAHQSARLEEAEEPERDHRRRAELREVRNDLEVRELETTASTVSRSRSRAAGATPERQRDPDEREHGPDEHDATKSTSALVGRFGRSRKQR